MNVYRTGFHEPNAPFLYTNIYHGLLIYKCYDFELKIVRFVYKGIRFSPTTNQKPGVNIYILGEIKTYH